MGRVAGLLPRQCASGGDPAGVTAHDFDDEDLGGGFAHGPHVQGTFQGRYGHILGDGTKAGAAVGERQVVVDGLGDADAGDRVAHALADLGNLVGGVLGVAAAVVEEVADVVGLEHFHQTLVFAFVFLEGTQLVAAGTESA